MNSERLAFILAALNPHLYVLCRISGECETSEFFEESLLSKLLKFPCLSSRGHCPCLG